MEVKVLDIKLVEKDYKEILIALDDRISILQKELVDKTDQEKDSIEFLIISYKMLIAKLIEAKLYNQ